MEDELILCSECGAVLLEDEVCPKCNRCGDCCACYETEDILSDDSTEADSPDEDEGEDEK